MEPFGAGAPDSHLYEVLGRAIGAHLGAAEEAEARRAASELFGRPDALELLREIVTEEGMLGALLERVRAGREEGRPVTPAAPSRAARVSLERGAPVLRAAAPGRRRALAAAAIVLIMSGVAAAYGRRNVLQWMRRNLLPAPHTIATTPGQRATVNLPDGSRAVLAPSTTLRYVISERGGPRVLELDGEAYFEVHHDPARPFRVRTRHAVVEDLGTTFVVREYPADAQARVAVRAGVVTLRARAAHTASPTLSLRHGEAAGLDSSGTVVRLAGDPAAYWAWTTGRLVFDQTPLPDVLLQLQRWYDVDFQLADSTVAGEYFTGAFDAASLSDVLEILGPLVHARFEQRGRVVTVTRRPGTP